MLPLASKVLSRILANRIQAGVDPLLRKEQAGFRKERRTTEQIFIVRNILEQVNEWNATIYIHFVDFEKAFDSIHRNSLWIIMRQYGIPEKLIRMVRSLYKDFQCAILVEGETTDWFPVITGVKQGCCMSGLLFLLVIDWVMRKTTEGERTGIRWNFTTMLEDLDFADDIAVLSSAMNHLQQKTAKLEDNAAKSWPENEQQEMRSNESQQQEPGEAERQRKPCRRGGQLHLSRGQRDEGWRRNSRHQKKDSLGQRAVQTPV